MSASILAVQDDAVVCRVPTRVPEFSVANDGCTVSRTTPFLLLQYTARILTPQTLRFVLVRVVSIRFTANTVEMMMSLCPLSFLRIAVQIHTIPEWSISAVVTVLLTWTFATVLSSVVRAGWLNGDRRNRSNGGSLHATGLPTQEPSRIRSLGRVSFCLLPTFLGAAAALHISVLAIHVNAIV